MSRYPDPNAIDLTIIKGDKGDQGTPGNASNGDTYYPYIGYAEDNSGTNPDYLSPTGKTHVKIVWSTDNSYAPYGATPMDTTAFNALAAVGNETGWIDFVEDINTLWTQTLFSDVSDGSLFTSNLKYRVIGNQVHFEGSVQYVDNTTLTADNSFVDTTIDIPTAAIPAGIRYFSVVIYKYDPLNSGNNEWYVIPAYVDTSGNLFVSKIQGINRFNSFYFSSVNYYKTT